MAPFMHYFPTMWIQTFIRATLVIALIASFQSCDEDNQQIGSCGVEDPLDELDWLAEIKNGFELSLQPASAQIVSYTFKDEQVFLVESCVGCADGLTSIYNCQGEVICEFGGIAGLNTCPDFEREAFDPQVLYANQCEQLAIEDSELYTKESDFFTFVSATISGDCLNIEFSASGCSGDSWTFQLIDAEEILESFPIQRNIKFLFENEELCQAVFVKTASFDLRPLQEGETGEIRLNLDGFDEQLSYSY